MERLNLPFILWTRSAAAVFVCLSPLQDQLFPGEVPHVSLAKPERWEWKDLELWLHRNLNLTDFCPVEGDPKTLYSRKGDVYKTQLTSTALVKRTVELIAHTNTHHMVSQSVPVDMTELSEVPTTLWAQSKYDVGLIKGASPLVVHPKSDYRPCVKQYPLKREAIEGIRPVFESLLEAGVIIPCDDSPVRTPFFLIKKNPRRRSTSRMAVCPGPQGSKCCGPSTCPSSSEPSHNLVTDTSKCHTFHSR